MGLNYNLNHFSGGPETKTGLQPSNKLDNRLCQEFEYGGTFGVYKLVKT